MIINDSTRKRFLNLNGYNKKEKVESNENTMKTATTKIVDRINIFILFLLLFLCWNVILQSLKFDLNDYMQITVQSGETLWGLSKQYSEQHAYNATQFTKWVEEKNNIEAFTLKAGETIYIPVKRAKD